MGYCNELSSELKEMGMIYEGDYFDADPFTFDLATMIEADRRVEEEYFAASEDDLWFYSNDIGSLEAYIWE